MCQSANLTTDCTEIVDEKPKTSEDTKEVTAEQTAEVEAEPEEIVDPEDPLYGLEQRLTGLVIDDESKRIIKDKLVEASNKIK
jgi:hypothetical protein